MAKTISGALGTHLASEVTSIATLWRVTRVDGVEFFFTDHDADIIFEGNTYEAAVGYNRTSVSNKVGLSVDNLDVSGFLDSSALTDLELRAGLFDFAEVRVSVVNWNDLSQGALKMRRGKFGEVKYAESGIFTTELRGMTQAYSQNIVEVYEPECRADLGDSRCKIVLFPSVVLRSTAYALGDRVRASSLLEDIPDATLLVPGDVDEDDISVNAAVGTLGSEAQQQTVVSKFGGGSIEFTPTSTVNNSANFLTFPDLSAYTIGANQVTIEGWFRWKSTSFPSNLQALASQYESVGNQRAWFLRWNGTGPAIDFFASANGTTTPFSITGASFTPTVGVQYHIAITRDSSNDWRIFIDGTQSGGTVNDSINIFNSNEDFTIGKINSGTNDQPSNVFVDDFRFVVGFAAYTANFTPPTAAHPTGPAVLIPTLVTTDFDDRVYVNTTAGTTAGVQPAYDTTVGNTTTDGTAVFTTEEAFTKAGTVEFTTDNRNFTVTFPHGADTREVIDWFKFGAVTWEAGNNTGLSMEVKGSTPSVTTGAITIDVDDTDTFSRSTGSFIDDGLLAGMRIVTTGFTDSANNGTFTVQTVNALTLDIVETTLVAESGTADEVMTSIEIFELFLDMPFDIQVGDTFNVYAGCDKRLTTCINKFVNAVNFRGEPYVPGQDAFLSFKTSR
jgi:hypothetical protein